MATDAMVRRRGSLLSTSFHIKRCRHDGPYIERFRQLIFAELEALDGEPAALVRAEADQLWKLPDDKVVIRGLCAAGAKVRVGGQDVTLMGDGPARRFLVAVEIGEGTASVPIEIVGENGARRTFRREFERVEE